MDINRREFVKAAAAAGVASRALAKTGAPARQGRVLGANDRINVGVIGVGGRGTYVGRKFAAIGKADNSCQVVAVCDVYQKRVVNNKNLHQKEYSPVDGCLDYREIIRRQDVDAVIVATPDHWHFPIALAAMEAGKDVYLEKPMVHTLEETRKLVEAVKRTGRVVQVGSHTTSAKQWWKAKQAIADGAIGRMIMSQGSYHRNSKDGEWNWPIDADAGPDKKGDDYVDWKMWLGSAPKRPWNADRFFRFRKYWDYSGGIATDLFFHVAAPMNICWPEPQFPRSVMASGGIYVFRDEREVPDTFHLVAEYEQGHSVVLSSSMANATHIPGLIRGHLGTIVMVDHGMFEGRTDHITLKPETQAIDDAYIAKFGKEQTSVPVEKEDALEVHVKDFLSCMRTRKKPTLDVETAARAQALITMAVISYRQGRVMYFDERKWKAVNKPPRA